MRDPSRAFVRPTQASLVQAWDGLMSEFVAFSSEANVIEYTKNDPALNVAYNGLRSMVNAMSEALDASGLMPNA